MKKETIHSSKLVLLSVGKQQWLGFRCITSKRKSMDQRGTSIACQRCPAIERATRGEVLCEELRLILTGHIYDVRHVVRRICQ